jgi:transcription regulator MmyB-like protein
MSRGMRPYSLFVGSHAAWRNLTANFVRVADTTFSPADRELKRLIAELTSHSLRFAELWQSGEVCSPQDQSRHKIIDHPDVGLIALDCDTLIVAGDDLRITVYTAEPGTEDAERLALAVVLGTQALID